MLWGRFMEGQERRERRGSPLDAIRPGLFTAVLGRVGSGSDHDGVRQPVQLEGLRRFVASSDQIARTRREEGVQSAPACRVVRITILVRPGRAEWRPHDGGSRPTSEATGKGRSQGIDRHNAKSPRKAQRDARRCDACDSGQVARSRYHEVCKRVVVSRNSQSSGFGSEHPNSVALIVLLDYYIYSDRLGQTSDIMMKAIDHCRHPCPEIVHRSRSPCA